MGILNRPCAIGTLYDTEGYLAQGWQSVDHLAFVLSQPHFEPEGKLEGETPQGGLPSYSSGFSTPSGHGSLDSESGILTRMEAQELRDLVAAVGTESKSSDDEENEGDDPFGDPAEDAEASSDADLAEATAALELDGELKTGIAAVKKEEDGRRREVGEKRPGSPQSTVFKVPSLPSSAFPGQRLKQQFMEQRIVSSMLVRSHLF
jgi:hypothetical protein